MPLTSACLDVSNFALCGIPFLAGFYSKDLILEMCLLRYVNVFGFLLFLFFFGLTVCYSLRLSYYVFCDNCNLFPMFSISEVNFNMIRGMLGLLLVTIFGGRLSALFFN
jgi:NADH-ubiquinone oxidoreductase chain 5